MFHAGYILSLHLHASATIVLYYPDVLIVCLSIYFLTLHPGCPRWPWKNDRYFFLSLLVTTPSSHLPSSCSMYSHNLYYYIHVIYGLLHLLSSVHQFRYTSVLYSLHIPRLSQYITFIYSLPLPLHSYYEHFPWSSCSSRWPYKYCFFFYTLEIAVKAN